MRRLVIINNLIILLWGGSIYSQDYNEEMIRQQLDKFIENPKLYYDKIKSLNDKAEKANANTLKVSEEYLSLMDKKDSLIKIYKNQAIKAKAAAPAVSNPTSSAALPAGTVVPKPAAAPAPKAEPTPYRVQLAAFFRDDFSKFFGTFNKTIGVEKLDNRNVIEVQGFKDSTEAYEFSQKISKLGFPGAFVTKYDNGVRQEGFAVGRSDSKFSLSSPATAKNVEYPTYVPIGYQELTGKKESASLSRSTAAPETKPVSPKPAEISVPTMTKKSILSSNAPVATPSTPKVTTSPPKNIASASTPPVSKPSSNQFPPVNKDTRDQLDAAFDQLFKR